MEVMQTLREPNGIWVEKFNRAPLDCYSHYCGFAYTFQYSTKPMITFYKPNQNCESEVDTASGFWKKPLFSDDPVAVQRVA